MRTRSSDHDLSVHAVVGTYVALLGINIRDESPLLDGLLGFAIHKTDHTQGRQGWLPAFKIFRNRQHPEAGRLVSTLQHPVQGFLWGDYGVTAGHEYTYRVVAMKGSPGSLQEEGEVVVRFTAEEADKRGGHSVHFNRGAASSQAYARKFQNREPDRRTNPKAYPWLSRGLEEAIIAFIRQAKAGWSLRAAVYEFNYDRVLEELREAARRGADVKIVFDAKSGAKKPRKRNLVAINENDLGEYCAPREANPSYIAHNKFIVLLRGREPILDPVAVWTGSTNITEGGIFGHSNVGHLVRDGKTARAYYEYWKQLAEDPKAPDLRAWNDRKTPVPSRQPRRGITPIFSPRGSLDALRYYAKLMNRAQSGVFFTAAFGVNQLLRTVLASHKTYLRYLLLEREDEDNPDAPEIALYKRDRENLIAVGSHLSDSVLERWIQKRFREEELTDLNSHVRYVHTKYMLIDPLSSDPIVITGSANFSNASTRNNDENMLVIRGDERVADIYLGEFMRLYSHYRFRAFVAQQKRNGRPPRRLYLTEDDAWLMPFYDPARIKMKERLLFA